MENQLAQPIQTTQPLQPTPPIQQVIIPEKPKTNFAMIGLVVLACLIVFGFGGYYLGKQQVAPVDQSTSNNTLQPTSLATPLPTTPTASTQVALNQKTYTSSNQNYVPNSFFQKFPNFKNDIPSKLTFNYPNTWEVFKVDSTPYNKTILMFSLHKNDPRFSNCRSDGPCENFADIQFRIGMTDSTIKDFDNEFWGQGYPIAKTTKNTINGVEVVQVFNTDTSPFPAGSLYKITSGAQVNATSEFFNFNDQNNELDYSKQTIQEINQILSSLKFED